MRLIAANIKWIMLISGVLTLTMLFAAIAPTTALQNMFGESLTGPVADIVVRSWGTLIAVNGVVLIYGATRPQYRILIVSAVGVSKLSFILLVASHWSTFMHQQVAVAAVTDSVIVILFVIYLGAMRLTAAP